MQLVFLPQTHLLTSAFVCSFLNGMGRQYQQMNDLFLIFEKIIHCLCFLLDMAVLIVKIEEKKWWNQVI